MIEGAQVAAADFHRFYILIYPHEPDPFSDSASTAVPLLQKISLLYYYYWNMRLLDIEISYNNKNIIILSMNDCLNYLERIIIVE